MAPILNHSRFIKINKTIIKVIIEMVIAKGLDITIFLELNQIDSNSLFFSAFLFVILPIAR